MPTFAGPFDARIESTKRLAAIYWRAEAELTHVIEVGCDHCKRIEHGWKQAAYEKHEAEMSLTARGVLPVQLQAIAGLAKLAATQNPDIHDFVLPKPERTMAQ